MQSNKERFFNVYREQLERSVINEPDQYAWPLNDLPVVFERMKLAIEKGSFNKDSSAMKRTCKYFGIKHTYKAIAEFIKE